MDALTSGLTALGSAGGSAGFSILAGMTFFCAGLSIVELATYIVIFISDDGLVGGEFDQRVGDFGFGFGAAHVGFAFERDGGAGLELGPGFVGGVIDLFGEAEGTAGQNKCGDEKGTDLKRI